MPAASEQLNVDLQQMIQDSQFIVKHATPGISTMQEPIQLDEKLLVSKLASYITRREHNAFNAGFQKAKNSKNKGDIKKFLSNGNMKGTR